MADNDLFGEDYMYFYADDAPDASVKRDVEIILRLLDLAPGSSLLEVGCGEGRLLRALARRGYRTTGVDRSSTMIEATLTRNGEDAAADYLIADVREMPAAPRFDGAFSWYTSFGYEDDSGNLDVLRGIRAQLRDGGRFAIDVTNRDYLTRNLRETQVFERGDDFIIDRLSYDPETSRMRNDRVNIRSSVRRVSFSLRLYSFPELSELLSRAGLGPSSPSFPKILRQTSRRASGSRRGLRDSTLSLAGARIRMGRRTASALAAWRVLASGSGSQRSGREGPPL